MEDGPAPGRQHRREATPMPPPPPQPKGREEDVSRAAGAAPWKEPSRGSRGFCEGRTEAGGRGRAGGERGPQSPAAAERPPLSSWPRHSGAPIRTSAPEPEGEGAGPPRGGGQQTGGAAETVSGRAAAVRGQQGQRAPMLPPGPLDPRPRRAGGTDTTDARPPASPACGGRRRPGVSLGVGVGKRGNADERTRPERSRPGSRRPCGSCAHRRHRRLRARGSPALQPRDARALRKAPLPSRDNRSVGTARSRNPPCRAGLNVSGDAGGHVGNNERRSEAPDVTVACSIASLDRSGGSHWVPDTVDVAVT